MKKARREGRVCVRVHTITPPAPAPAPTCLALEAETEISRAQEPGSRSPSGLGYRRYAGRSKFHFQERHAAASFLPRSHEFQIVYRSLLLFTFTSSWPLMTVTSDTRKPYSGNTRSLVLAFDVGTTFSGVSYAILEPNEIPMIHGVTRCVESIPCLVPTNPNFFYFQIPWTGTCSRQLQNTHAHVLRSGRQHDGRWCRSR